MNIHILLLILLFLSGITLSNAQSVISAAGSSYTGTSVSVDWTIGEPITSTFISEDLTVTQGFHQSNITVNAVDEISDFGTLVKVYPNPVPDILVIENQSSEMKDIVIRLFDISGKMLLKQGIGENISNLNMQAFRPGNYMLKVYSANDTPVRTFKIIKE